MTEAGDTTRLPKDASPAEAEAQRKVKEARIPMVNRLIGEKAFHAKQWLNPTGNRSSKGIGRPLDLENERWRSVPQLLTGQTRRPRLKCVHGF